MGTLREKKYVMYIVFLITLIACIGEAGQIIDIVTHSTFSVAGNGSMGGNLGEVMIMDGSGSNFVSPSSYGGDNDSNNNIITVSSSVEGGYSIY
ncbi:MAG: hypothetical protein LBC22_04220, partial [Endomicrobium sp.]|jgi:hypothetical protein|nr:hypothetical protein [Endomicrobium sp.]